VNKKTPQRVKHIPYRTCIGCRLVNSKRALVRIVRTAEGVKVDPTGKLAGRGAYVHNTRSCWELALKGPVSRALRTELTEDDRQRLLEYLITLPAEAATGTNDLEKRS
jgi:hypothetical protein